MAFEPDWDNAANPFWSACRDPGTMLLIAGTAAAAGGALYKGYSAKKQGETGQQIADYNAKVSENAGDSALNEAQFKADQLNQNANMARVAGQRAAQEQQRNLAQTVSSARAIAATSGGGGIETPSVGKIFGDMFARGDYLAGAERYKGETSARADENQASAAIMSGQAAKQRAYAQATSQRMGGAAAKTQGENAWAGSLFDAAGTGLTGGYKAYSNGRWDSSSGSGGYDPNWSNTKTVRYG